MGSVEHLIRAAWLVKTCGLSQRAEEPIEFVCRHEPRQFPRSSHGDGRARPRVSVQEMARQQPPAETAKARCASSDRSRREPRRALSFNESNETASINVSD